MLIDRLPNNESIMGRSHCDYCRKKIKWYDLVPIVSYFLLSGKCRYCKKPLSWTYPLVEFITGVMFVFVWHSLPYSSLAKGLQQLPETEFLIRFVYLAIVSSMIVIFFSDAKYHIISDQMQITLFALSLFLIPLQGFIPQVFLMRVIGALFIMSIIYFLYFITKGKGMGFGDVKLAFTIGFLFGIKGGIAVLYIAFVTGAVFGLILMAFRRKNLKSKIAFGPFLVFGMIILLFWQDKVFNFINNLYGM